MDKTKHRIAVKVQPRAKKTEFAGKIGDAYKLRLAAPPVDGKANEACIRFLAEKFGVTQSSVKIVQGAASRTKLIEVECADPAHLEHILAIESGSNSERT